MIVKVSTQAELDVALKNGDTPHLMGRGHFVVRSGHVEAREHASVEAWGNARVDAWNCSSVKARENSSVGAWGDSSVDAWENASVRAWGNSSVRARGNSSVDAWENSSVETWGDSSVKAGGNASVRAWENSSVETWGNSSVKAAEFVVVRTHPQYGTPKVTGGIQVAAPKLNNAGVWLRFHGVTVDEQRCTLFKAVGDDYCSPRGTRYAPGTTPTCDDWKPSDLCGHGLHISPSPRMAREYFPGAKRFVACVVDAGTIVPITTVRGYESDKCKVRAILECYEVDIEGNRIALV